MGGRVPKTSSSVRRAAPRSRRRRTSLARDAVTTEAFELLLKGKTGVVPAHRMLAFDPAAAGVARNLERRLIGHAVSDDLDMVMLVERMRHIEAGVRTALGDVDAARAILEELAASAEERGFVRLAAFYGRELAALGSGGRD